MSPPVPGLEPLTDAQRDWMAANDQLTRWGAARLMKWRPHIERDDAISLAAMAMIRAIHKHDSARGKLATCFFQQLRYVAGRNDYYARPLGCRHDDRIRTAHGDKLPWRQLANADRRRWQPVGGWPDEPAPPLKLAAAAAVDDEDDDLIPF